MEKKYPPRLFVSSSLAKFGWNEGAQYCYAYVNRQFESDVEYLSKEEFDAIVQNLVEALQAIEEETQENSNFSRSEDEAQYYIDTARRALENYRKQTGEGK